MSVDHYTHEIPDWPIVVYQAVDGRIPFAPFVAYPLIPTEERTKQGIKRSMLVTVRCAGRTADEAREAARQWIAAEVEKNRAKTENIKAGAEKRRQSREALP